MCTVTALIHLGGRNRSTPARGHSPKGGIRRLPPTPTPHVSHHRPPSPPRGSRPVSRAPQARVWLFPAARIAGSRRWRLLPPPTGARLAGAGSRDPGGAWAGGGLRALCGAAQMGRAAGARPRSAPEPGGGRHWKSRGEGGAPAREPPLLSRHLRSVQPP